MSYLDKHIINEISILCLFSLDGVAHLNNALLSHCKLTSFTTEIFSEILVKNTNN